MFWGFQDGYTLGEVQASGMRCTGLTLRAGETLYLPKGAVHRAAAGETGSAHVTLTLSWEGGRWSDLLWDMVGRLPDLLEPTEQHGGDGNGDQPPDTPGEAVVHGLRGALQIAQEQPEGVVLLQPLSQLRPEIVSRRMTQQHFATLSAVVRGLLGICAEAIDAFFGDSPPPRMVEALAVARQLDHTAWLSEYAESIAQGYARMMEAVQTKVADGGAGVEVAVARAVYEEYAMVLDARTAKAQFHFDQADQVKIEDTMAVFEQAMVR